MVALALPDFLRMRASTLLATIPEFAEVLRMPEWERTGRRCRTRPHAPRWSRRSSAPSAGEFAAIGRWDLLEIAEAAVLRDCRALVGLHGRTWRRRSGATTPSTCCSTSWCPRRSRSP